MAAEKIEIEAFLNLAKQFPVLDARSPGEYDHAHIPGAFSIPLFSDEERKVVGTAYKQQSREAAIKIGLDYFGVKMRKIVEEAELITGHQSPIVGQSFHGGQTNTSPKVGVNDADSTGATSRRFSKVVLVHCWRGGMRSAAIAWLLDMYGFKVYTLAAGYKRFRQYILETFSGSYQFAILGGFTGSGKTYVLQELEKRGQYIIDLEALANHKGSAFGSLGQPAQPSQEMFENLLGLELKLKSVTSAQRAAETGVQVPDTQRIWLEDESQRIGALIIPPAIWKQMRESVVYFLDIPFEERLSHIQKEYGSLDKEKLLNSILRIRARLGGLETKTAVQFLAENDIRECFRILLTYYDKYYLRGLQRRDGSADQIKKISCHSINTCHSTEQLLRSAGYPEKQFSNTFIDD